MEDAITSISKIMCTEKDVDDNLDYYISHYRDKIASIEKKEKEREEKHTNTIVMHYNELKDLKNVADQYTKEIDSILIKQEEFLTLVPEFEVIKKLTRAYKNLNLINEMKEKLENLDALLDEIKEKTGIKEAYDLIKELDMFRLKLLYYSEDSDKDVFLSIRNSINEIEKAKIEFFTQILTITSSFEFNDLTLEEILYVIKEEEKDDEITRRCYMALKIKVDTPNEDDICLSPKEKDRFFQNLNDEQEEIYNQEILKANRFYTKRKIFNLRKKFIRALMSFIDKRFKNLKEKEFFIDRLDFVFEDIHFIHRNLRKVEFLREEVLLSRMHKNLCDYIKSKEKKLDATEILALLEFSEKYSTEMSSINMQEFSSQTILGEDEEFYIEQYITAINEKLGEWIGNILVTEIEKFTTRNEKPAVDEENKFISTGFITLLNLIKQQLEPVSFNPRIFKEITKVVLKSIEVFKKELFKVMEKDLTASYMLKSKVGYEEYVIMIGNSGLKLTQYVNSLPESQNEGIKKIGALFIDILKKTNQLLSTFVIKTCSPVVDKIFTDDWYNSDTTENLTATLDDFMSDYQNTMSQFSFITFTHELSNTVTQAYLKQIKRKRAKILYECPQILERDCNKISKVFYKFEAKEEIDKIFKLKKIIPLIKAPNPDIFLLELKSLLHVYPNVGKDVIKSIIQKREDIEEEEKKEWNSLIKECYKEEDEEKKGIFSKIKWN